MFSRICEKTGTLILLAFAFILVFTSGCEENRFRRPTTLGTTSVRDGVIHVGAPTSRVIYVVSRTGVSSRVQTIDRSGTRDPRDSRYRDASPVRSTSESTQPRRFVSGDGAYSGAVTALRVLDASEISASQGPLNIPFETLPPGHSVTGGISSQHIPIGGITKDSYIGIVPDNYRSSIIVSCPEKGKLVQMFVGADGHIFKTSDIPLYHEINSGKSGARPTRFAFLHKPYKNGDKVAPLLLVATDLGIAVVYFDQIERVGNEALPKGRQLGFIRSADTNAPLLDRIGSSKVFDIAVSLDDQWVYYSNDRNQAAAIQTQALIEGVKDTNQFALINRRIERFASPPSRFFEDYPIFDQTAVGAMSKIGVDLLTIDNVGPLGPLRHTGEFVDIAFHPGGYALIVLTNNAIYRVLLDRHIDDNSPGHPTGSGTNVDMALDNWRSNFLAVASRGYPDYNISIYLLDNFGQVSPPGWGNTGRVEGEPVSLAIR